MRRFLDGECDCIICGARNAISMPDSRLSTSSAKRSLLIKAGSKATDQRVCIPAGARTVCFPILSDLMVTPLPMVKGKAADMTLRPA